MSYDHSTRGTLRRWLSTANRGAQHALLVGVLTWLVITLSVPESALPVLRDRLELVFVVVCLGLPGVLYVAQWLTPEKYPRYVRAVLVCAALLTTVAFLLKMPIAVTAGIACPITVAVWSTGPWLLRQLPRRRVRER